MSNAASIMSYCDFCSGGLSNVALSMGGVWTGDHPRLDVKNWKPSNEFTELTVSKDPERVSHQIWTTLYKKGQCIIKQTAPPTKSPVTSHPSKQPVSSSPTSSSPTFRPITAKPTTVSPTKMPSVAPTINYGPFFIAPPKTCEDVGSCYLSRGIMFDVSLGANARQDILVESITFEHTEPRYSDVSIDLYRTFVGGYEDKVNFSAQWNKLDTKQVRATHGLVAAPGGYVTSEFKLDPPVTVSPESSFGFYLRASSSVLRVGTGSNANTDSNGVFIGPGSTVMGGIFGIGIEGYLFNVSVRYSIIHPTGKPTTGSPTLKRPTSPNLTSSQSASSLFASPTAAESSDTSKISLANTAPAPAAALSYWLSPSKSCNSNCLASSGFMFDVKVNMQADQILVKSIEFEHLRGSPNSIVDMFTTFSGSLEGKEQTSSQWKKAASITLSNSTSSNTTATFNPPISISNGITKGFYLKANEGILLVGLGSADNSDANGVSLQNGNVVFGQFGKSYSGYHLNARIRYDIKTK